MVSIGHRITIDFTLFSQHEQHIPVNQKKFTRLGGAGLRNKSYVADFQN